jgi:acyl-CoA synthetase (NDP forming)
LAADDVATEALFHQTGVIRADTLGEMFDLAAALSSQPLPKGRRVAILTNAGGLGILCADACEANGLVVPEPNDEIKRQLRAFLPAAASVGNPVDMIASASADEFRKAAEILLGAPQLDALIVPVIDVGLAKISEIWRNVQLAAAAVKNNRVANKPVLTCFMDEDKVAGSAASELPNYRFPENTARVLGKLADYAEWLAEPKGTIIDFEDINAPQARTLCQRALAERRASWLSGDETHKVLSDFRLPLPAGRVCSDDDEAAATAARIGFPVALKLSSRVIVHKSEVGGVVLNLGDAPSVRRAFREIQQRLMRENRLKEMDGVLVQPMISGGVEVMIGITQDALFGPLIGFGLGGVHVEILKDVCFRVTPITDRDAAEMVRSIKGFRLLEGYRNHPPADIPAIEELLLRTARLVEEIPEITELDLNPVIVLPPGQGCMIVDARIRVG